MIKRYNQFVKENINEDFQMAEPATEPAPAPTTKPGTKEEPTQDPSEKPGKPSPFKKDRKSPIPAPSKAHVEEEIGEYQGTRMLKELSDIIGAQLNDDNSIDYEGKKINYFSEDEKFHIGKEKFDTVDDVVDYLESGISNETDIEDYDDDSIDMEDEFIEEEEPEEVYQNESKSYRNRFKK